jgi:hypothetical protein
MLYPARIQQTRLYANRLSWYRNEAVVLCSNVSCGEHEEVMGHENDLAT